MNKLKKYTLIVLSAFMFLVTFNLHNAFADHAEKVVFRDKDALVKVNNRGNQRIVEVINYKNHKRFLYTINKSDIQLKTFDAKGKLIEFKNLTSEKANKVQLIQSSDKMLKARKPISWGKVIATQPLLQQKLWYQMGYRNKTTYMRIGCKARYTINYNDLSKWQMKRCEWYSKSIRYCNNYMNELNLYFFGGIITSCTIVEYALPLLTGGLVWGAVIAAIVGAFGVIAHCAELSAKAANEYADADYFYDVIKVWA